MNDLIQSVGLAAIVLGILLSAFWVYVGFKNKTNDSASAPRLASFPGGAASWTENDRDQWSAFLKSNTGRKLEARLRATEAYNAITSCQDRTRTADSAARAGGYSECVKHLLSLTTVAERPADSPENKPVPSEADELIARLSP